MNSRIQEPINTTYLADIDIILGVMPSLEGWLGLSEFTKCRVEGGMSREQVVDEMISHTVPGFKLIILSSRDYYNTIEGNRIKNMNNGNIKIADKLASSKQSFSRFKEEMIDAESPNHQKDILEEFMRLCADESISYKNEVESKPKPKRITKPTPKRITKPATKRKAKPKTKREKELEKELEKEREKRRIDRRINRDRQIERNFEKREERAERKIEKEGIIHKKYRPNIPIWIIAFIIIYLVVILIKYGKS